jgi:pimeloyl-ACP methyl ester carboxylesterase
LKQLKELGVAGLAESRSHDLVSGNASPETVELIQWNMKYLSLPGYTQAAHMLAAANLLGDATAFPGQVLVACGTEDTITPEEKCRRVASAFRYGNYKGLPGLGHASYIEDPAKVNQEIAEFYLGLPND